MDPHAQYANPLASRYASQEMIRLWSEQNRIGLWRQLWIALAQTQRSLGLPISQEQLDALAQAATTIDFARARDYESRLRHDVMAHVHAFGDAAPAAKAIIHLGATSCYVTDNADLILIRQALRFVRDDLVRTIDALAAFSLRWKDLPCLGYTHFQPAQLVTVGKRAALWCQDLVLDLQEVERRLDHLPFLGAKGTTGTQASFLALFDGDQARVDALDRSIAELFGFKTLCPVSGQTYPRKIDAQVVGALGGLATSAHRFGTDLRLLQHESELAEPFEADQIGSSAMAYKRNPMRAERMCSIARYLSCLPPALEQTAAVQWLERTLDDSALRRIVIPQAFLAADAILRLYLNIIPGLEVRPAVIARHVAEHLPEMATENLLMAGVRAGGDRQALHERIRQHSQAANERRNSPDGHFDLIDRLKSDPDFARLDLQSILNPESYCGCAPAQVQNFYDQVIRPILARYPQLPPKKVELTI
jgi:adenylosuccinate lyase